MPFLAAVPGLILAGAAAASNAIILGLGTGALATGLSGAVLAAGNFGASLLGGAGIMAAIHSWSTVALFASTALSRPKVGQGSGAPTDFQADPNAGIPLMLGRSATAGKVLHAQTNGQANKNEILSYLLALTGGPLGQLESVTASDFPVTFDAFGVCKAPVQYADQMWLRSTPGLKPDPSAYWPLRHQPDQIPEWTAAHKLSGVACVWWTLHYKQSSYPAGMPKPLFVIVGPGVYDPRQDSTYPGGVGAQRWNDESTWTTAGNDNPFLQGLAWSIGRHDNGVLTFGIGAPIDAIDVGAFVEGANVCEANNWTVGGEVLSSDRKWDVLTAILQAGGGEPAKLGGLISCQVRAPRVTLGTLVGADVVGDVSITGSKRRRDRINQIIPNYRSEDHRWEMVPAGPVKVPEYVAADGGLRSREGNYSLVQDAKQVAELAAYDLLDAREFEPIVLPLGPRWLGLKPGDSIIIDEPEFGMVGQPVIVQTRELDPLTGRVTLTCRSETAGKHDYALGRTPSPPPIPGMTPLDPAYVSRPDAGIWVATGGVLSGADGAQIPALIVTGAINDANVAAIIVEYALQLSPGVFGEFASGEFPATTKRMEFRSVVSGGTYHVQIRYRSVRGVIGALALDLGLVTVGTLISGGVTQIGGQTPGELLDQLNETTDTANEAAAAAGAVASDLEVVSSTVDGHTATIAELSTSVDGLESQWVLAVSSSGPTYKRVAGIKLSANPAVSAMAFLADEIGFTNGVDDVFPLAIVGGKVIATDFQADDIKAGTIYTDKIVANNISVGSRVALPTPVNLPRVYPQLDLVSTVFPCSGGYIDIDVWGSCTQPADYPGNIRMDLFMDGVSLATFGATGQPSASFVPVPFTYRHKPPAGNHTYKIAGVSTGLSAAATGLLSLYLTIRDNKTEA